MFKNNYKSIFATILMGFLAYFFYKSHSFLVISFGIAIFLYAMSVLEQSFGLMVNVDKFVKKLTDKNYKSFLFGLISTCLAQSSGLISLIAISFASAGLITLAAGLCIIYGANIGTTTGAWIIAAFGVKIDIAKYAMPMVVFGVIFILNKNRRVKGIGYFLFSVGVLFLGIAYIKDGFEGMKNSIDLASFGMNGYKGVLVYSFIGFIITVITQSSHATLAIAITALSKEQISYENALAIAIGSNIGSTVMAFIGSLNSNTEGKRLMAGHLLFNVTSAVITIIFIYPLMSFVDISSSFLGIRADDYTLKLALFHTYFNVIGTMIFYPINSKVVTFLEKMIKEKNARQKASTVLYLNKDALSYSDSAKEVLILEIKHLYSNTISILAKALSLNANDLNSNLSEEGIIYSKDKTLDINLNKLYEDRFKCLYNEIVNFTIEAQKTAQNEEDMKIFMAIRRGSLRLAEILKDLETIYPNLNKFLNSSNHYIKDEYNKLRIKAFKSINIVNSAIQLDDEKEIYEKLLELRNIVKSYDLIGESDMGKLLSKNLITSSMATSLMNDTLMMKSISKNLEKIIKMNYDYYKYKSETMSNKKANNEEENKEKSVDEILAK